MVKRREVRGGVNNTQLLSQCSSMRDRIYNSITGQDCVCSFKNKCDGNKSRKRQKYNSQWWHLIKCKKKLTIYIYLWHEYEILNSPHPNKKHSLAAELVRDIVCEHNTALKNTRVTQGEREKQKNKKVIFTHDHREQPAKIINTRQLSTASRRKKQKNISVNIYSTNLFPFIYQALTKPYCTLSRPTPSDPPTHICDSLTLQFTTCRDGRGRDSIWITTQICEWFIVLKTMGRFSATPLFLSITPIGRPWTITVWTN